MAQNTWLKKTVFRGSGGSSVTVNITMDVSEITATDATIAVTLRLCAMVTGTSSNTQMKEIRAMFVKDSNSGSLRAAAGPTEILDIGQTSGFIGTMTADAPDSNTIRIQVPTGPTAGILLRGVMTAHVDHVT